jgi:hypothetical protein
MACGAEHSVALLASGEVYAWGWGAYGNLGDGEMVDRWVPVKVRCMHAWPALPPATGEGLHSVFALREPEQCPALSHICARDAWPALQQRFCSSSAFVSVLQRMPIPCCAFAVLMLLCCD